MHEISWSLIEPIENKKLVENFCTKIGIDIPRDLLIFICSYNGGSPDKDLFDTGDSQEHTVSYVLSYHQDSLENVYDMYDALCLEHDKSHLLPIFSNDGGNLVCYDSQGKKIVFWNHETNMEEVLAPTIQEFVSMLY